MTVSQANNITLTALAVAPANLTTDPYQTTQALSGLIGQLAIWTRHVADSLNVLYRAGTITNGMLLIGDATNSVFDLGTLTAGTNISITNGAGIITIAGSGTTPPNPGNPNAILFYGNPATSVTSSVDWTIVSNVLTGTLNAAALPAAPTDTVERLAQADGHGTVMEMLTANNGNNVFNNIIGRHSRGTVASPTATQNGDVIQQVEGRGFGTAYAPGARNALTLAATENWTGTNQGANAILYGTPKGSTAVQANVLANSEGVQVRGTNTNDNPPAGFDGEYVELHVLSGGAGALTSGVSQDIASISLTAGDWDVDGQIGLITTGAGGTITFILAWVNTTSVTAPTAGFSGYISDIENIAQNNAILIQRPTGTFRVSTASTVTVFLSCDIGFGGGTIGCSAYGQIRARRIR